MEEILTAFKSRIPEIIQNNEKTILADWALEQQRWTGAKISNVELNSACQEFMRAFVPALQSNDITELHHEGWKQVKSVLASVSRSRTTQGFSPSETATFVLSLKRPIFVQLQRVYENNAGELGSEIWTMTTLLDHLALFTIEIYQKAREEIIIRQQEDMLELSTPVVKLWDGILALPMIGTLDSSRTQVVMESLLQRIVETNSEIAIIDITGVPTVDT
jgi:rsbT co-antagonist protein RsbR